MIGKIVSVELSVFDRARRVRRDRSAVLTVAPMRPVERYVKRWRRSAGCGRERPAGETKPATALNIWLWRGRAG